ncbi:MAG: hypothetical protein H6Q21_1831 [Bacteroidetes bacterium]|jgi:hypothetical protein|nr:hypothetical protein [Bacteroidota bacterium]
MNNESAIQLTESRINDLGLYLAEFALDFVPGDEDVYSYDANDFLALFDQWFPHFIRYAETNRMFDRGEREALTENIDELVGYIKDAAIDAAREIIMEKI